MAIQVVKNSTKQQPEKKDKKDIFDSLSKTQRIDGKIVITKAAPDKKDITTSTPQKISVKKSPSGKHKSSDNGKKPASLKPAGGGKKLAVAAVVMVAGLVTLILVKVGSAGTTRQQTQIRPQSTQHTHKDEPYVPKRYEELGGLTMAEWEKLNNTNNALLKARKAHKSFR